MNRYFVTGGFVGFLLGFLGNLFAGGHLNIALRDGMVGCLIVGFAFRFLYHQIQQGALAILRREAEARFKEEEAE